MRRVSAVAIRTWLASARLRTRAGRLMRPPRDRLQIVREHARGRSFADIGCMWGVDGEVAFEAEAAGATSVSALDVMAPTAGFEAERARRGSSVRYIQADIHDERAVAELGPHQTVWCSGVIYHAPHPLLTVQRLCSLTTETLIVASETIPEVPGLSQACVFFPSLDAAQRRAHASARAAAQVGLTSEFDSDRAYENWYWGLSASALAAMIKSCGFEIVSREGSPLHVTLIARPTARA